LIICSPLSQLIISVLGIKNSKLYLLNHCKIKTLNFLHFVRNRKSLVFNILAFLTTLKDLLTLLKNKCKKLKNI